MSGSCCKQGKDEGWAVESGSIGDEDREEDMRAAIMESENLD